MTGRLPSCIQILESRRHHDDIAATALERLAQQENAITVAECIELAFAVYVAEYDRLRELALDCRMRHGASLPMTFVIPKKEGT